MSATALARPEIVEFKAYVTAEQKAGSLRLNANESPYPPPASGRELNRYPRIRPDQLETLLASEYGVATGNLLVTRGSSEAIDILIRTFCRSYRDNIVTTPPTFAMYKVYADMQAADVREAALANDGKFSFDVEAILSACNEHSKLIFLCSPNNPTGNCISREQVRELASARLGQSLIVVDEAYVEFSNTGSLTNDATDLENLVVLRTLSKADALAGARCGSLIASGEIIGLTAKMLPPYAFATPTADCLVSAFGPEARVIAKQQLAATLDERTRVAAVLADIACVEELWPSQANFLLARFSNLEAVAAVLDEAGILIRLFSGNPALERCARITIGTPDENNALLSALKTIPESRS